MKNSTRGERALSLLVLCVSLATSIGCGEKARLVVSTPLLEFRSDEEAANPPPAQVIRGEVLNLEGGGFLAAAHSQNSLEAVSITLANPFTVTVLPKGPRALGHGTYDDVVVIAACEDAECDQPFEGSPVTVPVIYTVTGHLKVTAGPLNRPELTHVIGSPAPDGFPIEISGPGRTWTASTSQSWLRLSASSGRSPAIITATVDPTGLAVGDYSSTVVFTDTETQEQHPLQVLLKRQLPTLSASSVSFTNPIEGAYAPQQITLKLTTGANAHPWTASIDHGSGPRWLMLSALSGTVSALGAETPLVAIADTTGLRDGTYFATIRFTAQVEGQPLTQSVQAMLSYRAHRLLNIPNGVALVSAPSLSRLTTSMVIRDNQGSTRVPWAASSNQDWLSVTPSGVMGDTLTLTANPAGLATDSLHLATVTIGSSALSVTNQLTIRVGLWVGASAPDNLITVPTPYRVVEADPIRPYAYVHDGSNLVVYNVYTGARITTLSNLGSATGMGLGGMTVSGDGSTLYVADRDARQVVPINLNTLAIGSRWSLGSGNSQSLVYALPFGGDAVVLAGNGRAYNATTGALLPATFVPRDALSVSRDGNRFCSVGPCTTASCAEAQCYSLIYFSQEALSILPNGPMNLAGAVAACNGNGSRYYVATPTQSTIEVLGTSMNPLQSLSVGATPNGLVVGVDDRLYGSAYTRTGPVDVWSYDNTGAAQGSLRLGDDTAGILARQLKVSGDGKRLVVLTESSLKLATPP